MNSKKKILVILGPTSSGKSELAVEFAQKFSGEVVSADSRQIYRGLDVGTGKITRSEMGGVLHHLLDVADVGEYFSVADYKHLADEAIHTIYRMNKIPILAGGTGLYIQAVVDDVTPPEVPPDKKLRAKLEKQSPEALLKILRELDPKRAETVEPENPRRLIRAIEIARALGHVPERATDFPADYDNSPYDILQIGITTDDNPLKKHIEKRVKERLNAGWMEEVGQLVEQGVPAESIAELGLGYSIIYSIILQNYGIDKEEVVEKITTAEWQYAKRQHKWFKRDSRIEWFSLEQKEKISQRVKKFLGS